MKKSHAIGLVLVSVALSHALAPAIAWAQFKVQSALDGAAITPGTVAASGSAPQFSCSKTDATCQLTSATVDGTTSSTVGAITLKASADITAADLLLDVQDSAGNHVASMTEAGAVTLGAASGVGALTMTQGAFFNLKVDATNKIYSSASSNFVLHVQSSKNLYMDIGSSTGAFLFNPDNAVDIGSTAAARPKDLYVAGTAALEAASGNALTVVGGGYARFTFNAGAPTGTDCDAAGESGRIAIDTTNNRFYFCNGAAWQYVNEDVP